MNVRRVISSRGLRLIAALALVGACGDGGDSIPIERFELELAKAYCAAAKRCEIGSPVDTWISVTSDVGGCDEAFARLLAGEGGFAQMRAAVAAGDMTYDGDAARACVDSFQGRCPPCTEWDPEEWCPEAFTGACRTPTKAPWQAPVRKGGACGVDAQCCAAGLSCVGDETRVCQPRLPAGSACSESDCALGLVCTQEPSGTGMTCQAPPAQDAEMLVEILTTDRPRGSSCYKPGDYFRQGLCNAGLVCQLDTMTCGTPRENGAPCQSSGECAGTCELDLDTSAGTCSARPASTTSSGRVRTGLESTCELEPGTATPLEATPVGDAGSASEVPGLGEPCTGPCATGFVCEGGGAFAGQCTASCGGDEACNLLAPGAQCVGASDGQCGLPCTQDGECPTGTHCIMVSDAMACVLDG